MRQRLLLLALLAAALPAQALAQQGVARGSIDTMIEEHAKAHGVPADFVHRVVRRESNYNPNAKGGSALGLMQIKHATARGIGYRGDAAGLYDPNTNLKFGIAYLAGAYRTAKGDTALAYHYYSRGYYYAAKRRGITTEVADLDASAPKSASSFGDVFGRAFGLRTNTTAPILTASADPGSLPAAASPQGFAGTAALAYAPAPAAAGAAPTETVEVPLPPRRPASLSAAEPAQVALPTPPGSPAAATPPAAAGPRTTEGAPSETVEVPLPPRRPSATMLAAIGRPAAKKADAPVLEASAAPGQ